MNRRNFLKRTAIIVIALAVNPIKFLNQKCLKSWSVAFRGPGKGIHKAKVHYLGDGFVTFSGSCEKIPVKDFRIESPGYYQE